MDNIKPPSADLDGDTLSGNRVTVVTYHHYKRNTKKGPGKGSKRSIEVYRVSYFYY